MGKSYYGLAHTRTRGPLGPISNISTSVENVTRTRNSPTVQTNQVVMGR